jgi:hypothetical protein
MLLHLPLATISRVKLSGMVTNIPLLGLDRGGGCPSPLLSGLLVVLGVHGITVILGRSVVGGSLWDC